MNRYLLIPVTLLLLLVAACAPASTSAPAPAAAPTVDAMMQNEAPTTEAMMTQGTETPNAMMEHATGTPDAMMSQATPGAGAMMDHLPDQVKTPHWLDSSPKQGDQFAHAPDKVAVNFDSTLTEGSTLAVTRDGAPVDIGKPTVSDKTLSATLPMAGPGVYVVKYKACWAGGTCDDGQFAFAVNAQ